MDQRGGASFQPGQVETDVEPPLSDRGGIMGTTRGGLVLPPGTGRQRRVPLRSRRSFLAAVEVVGSLGSRLGLRGEGSRRPVDTPFRGSESRCQGSGRLSPVLVCPHNVRTVGCPASTVPGPAETYGGLFLSNLKEFCHTLNTYLKKSSSR